MTELADKWLPLLIFLVVVLFALHHAGAAIKTFFRQLPKLLMQEVKGRDKLSKANLIITVVFMLTFVCLFVYTLAHGLLHSDPSYVVLLAMVFLGTFFVAIYSLRELSQRDKLKQMLRPLSGGQDLKPNPGGWPTH